MENRTNVFDYITSEVISYKTKTITLGENWNWNMYEHVNRSFLMKHSKFFKGSNELGNRPYKNVIRPILNVGYRSEGFDVKDIQPFVNNPDNYYKSFLVRQFHPKWAVKNQMDTFIDEIVESYVDYGLAIAKNVNDVRPECVPLQRIAFVDQRDVMSGAKCEHHDYSIDQLLEMKKYWNPAEIDKAITMSRSEKPNSTGTGTEKSNSKSIEVFELHGTFPETWLDAEGDPDKYSKQIHIVTYYKDPKDDTKKIGIQLFKGKEYKEIYKVIVRDGIYNRACGYGGVEELFDPQVWVNYNIIQIKEMLDVASLMLVQTADANFAGKNKVSDLKKGEIVVHAADMPVTQVQITPVNIQMFENAIIEWEQSARVTGSASDPQLAIDPAKGTPLGTTQIVTEQGEGLHQYRRGKIAVFIEEVYRDWVLKFLVAEMNKGSTFLEELSLEEMEMVAEKMIDNWVNMDVKQKILDGKAPTPEAVAAFKELEKQKWMKGGTKRYHQIMADELKGIPVDVSINVAGKQKDMAKMAEGFSNIFKLIIANPAGFVQAMQVPQIAQTFNSMMEMSGMDQINFGSMPKQALPAPAGGPAPAPGAGAALVK